MKTIEKTCRYCASSFITSLREHKRGRNNYCSKECRSKQCSENMRAEYEILNAPNTKCSTCNSPLYRSKGDLKKSKHGFYFCNRTCLSIAKRIDGIKEIHPSHYSESSKNYRARAFSKYDNKCANCGYSEHIEILHVHHIDSNHSNNTVENLTILCPTCHESDHFINKTGKWTNKI